MCLEDGSTDERQECYFGDGGMGILEPRDELTEIYDVPLIDQDPSLPW